MKAKRYLFFISQNYSYAILRPVQEAILGRGGEVAWFLEGKYVNEDYLSQSETRLTSIRDIRVYSPDAILFPSNLAPTFLPGINVAVFHGFDAGKLDSKGKNDHYKIRNCFDLYCTQGPESSLGFQLLKKKNSHFEVIETGWCALDPLFGHPAEQERNDRPTILMCSTFSRKLSCAPFLFETVERLSQSGKWRWLVQFHPKMNREIVNQYKSLQSDFLKFFETDDVTQLLHQADVMVCDTSSVLIMFLLLQKPVVTFKNIAPKDYLLNIDAPDLLEGAIEGALSRPEELMINIQRFGELVHPYTDGKSSERLLNAIDTVLSDRVKLGAKPIDLARQLKMRKRLGYWKFW